MESKILKNKPLVEAIFEVRWGLKEIEGHNVRIDPHYDILLGSFYQAVKDSYPYHEKLAAAEVPDELTPYVVKHRFRKSKNEWPLVQIGPGVLSLNNTVGYIWDDFRARIHKVVNALQETHPNKEELNMNGLLLRYIDAVDFDFETDNIVDYLRTNMKLEVKFKPILFEDTDIKDVPHNCDIKFSFKSEKPPGLLVIRFNKGKRENKDALIWETVMKYNADEKLDMNDVFSWVDESHELLHNWFFRTIEGSLYRRFK